jgi:hypothetical protein
MHGGGQPLPILKSVVNKGFTGPYYEKKLVTSWKNFLVREIDAYGV